MNKEVAVYIHIPFCKKICSYCDFCKVLYKADWVNEYLNKLEEEINDNYMGETIKSIYIGGGTPSSLSINQLGKLFHIIEVFNIKEKIEFTFECNLNDLSCELLEFLKNHNVNRLSIGIESFDENKLKFMNRNHTFNEAIEKISLARNLGFNNINVDLIYAIPGETLKVLKSDLNKIFKLKPDHISTYSLIIEDNTYIKVKDAMQIPEELDYYMYKLIKRKLSLKGYKNYEFSNFSKPGFESKHNLTYWNNEEYYGFGCGAAGYLENVRYENTKSLTKYLKGDINRHQTILSKKDMMDNEVMLGLRKTKGINLNNFEEKYNVKFHDVYKVDDLLKNKYLKIKKGYIYIDPSKLYIMNEILLKLI